MTADQAAPVEKNNSQQQAPERVERTETTPGLGNEIGGASQKGFNEVQQEWQKQSSLKGDNVVGSATGDKTGDLKTGDNALKSAENVNGQGDSPESRAQRMGMTAAELQKYESGEIDFNKNKIDGFDDRAHQGSVDRAEQGSAERAAQGSAERAQQGSDRAEQDSVSAQQGSERAAMVSGAAPTGAEAALLRGNADGTQQATRGLEQQQVRAGQDQTPDAQDRAAATNPGDVNGALKRLQDGGWLKEGADGKLQTGDNLTDKTAKGHFGEQVNNFLNRADITPEQKASVLNSTADLLGMKQGENSVLGQQHRELLATTQLENLSNWRSDDQGDSNRCNVAQLAGARNYLAPEKVAQMTNDIAKDGFLDIPAGESSTGQARHIYMGEALQNTGKGIDGGKGDSNEAGKLHQIALAKEINDSRGLLYTQGEKTANNPTGERVSKIDGYDSQGRPIEGALKSTGSPGMTMADVADAAKSKELGIANNVTVVADKTWNNGRESSNLEVLRNPGDMNRIVENAQKQDKHYMIMGVSGGDRSVADASGQRDVARGDGHYAHAIGAAWNKTQDINPRVNGENNGGEWAGNNTWGNDKLKVGSNGERLGNDNIWDKNLVGADGKMNIASAERAMDMKVDRKGNPGFDGSEPYKEYHKNNPGVNRREGGIVEGGTEGAPLDSKDKQDKPEEQKKPEDEKKKVNNNENEFEQRAKDLQKASNDAEFHRLQTESRRIEADIAHGLGNTAALYGQLSSVHGLMAQVA